MTRRERVVNDRVEMVTRALIKAGYLAGDEGKKWEPEFFVDVASGLLADLLHLGFARVDFKDEPPVTDGRMADAIATKAVAGYRSDNLAIRD